MGVTTENRTGTSPLSSKQADKATKQQAATAVPPADDKAAKKAERQKQREEAKTQKAQEREARKARRQKERAEKQPRALFRAEDAPLLEGDVFSQYDAKKQLPPKRSDFKNEADFFDFKAAMAEKTARKFRELAEEIRTLGSSAEKQKLKKFKKIASEYETLLETLKKDNPDFDVEAFLASLKKD